MKLTDVLAVFVTLVTSGAMVALFSWLVRRLDGRARQDLLDARIKSWSAAKDDPQLGPALRDRIKALIPELTYESPRESEVRSHGPKNLKREFRDIVVVYIFFGVYIGVATTFMLVSDALSWRIGAAITLACLYLLLSLVGYKSYRFTMAIQKVVDSMELTPRLADQVETSTGLAVDVGSLMERLLVVTEVATNQVKVSREFMKEKGLLEEWGEFKDSYSND